MAQYNRGYIYIYNRKKNAIVKILLGSLNIY